MPKQQFSLRAFLIASVLLGFVVIPFGYERYLKRQNTIAIPVFYSEVEAVAAVLGEIYGDRLTIDVELASCTIVMTAPPDMIAGIRKVVSALDAPPTSPVVTVSLPNLSPDTAEESLRRLLDQAEH